MKSVRATFSLDAATADAIRRLAAAWRISRSAVVLKPVEELDDRRDLLTEKERLHLLGTLDRWLATDPTRSRSEALAEIEEVREAHIDIGASLWTVDLVHTPSNPHTSTSSLSLLLP